MRTKYVTDQLLILLEVSPLVLKHSERCVIRDLWDCKFQHCISSKSVPCTPSQVAHLVRVYLGIHSTIQGGILLSLPPQMGCQSNHKVTTLTPPVFHRASLASLPPPINTPESKEVL